MFSRHDKFPILVDGVINSFVERVKENGEKVPRYREYLKRKEADAQFVFDVNTCLARMSWLQLAQIIDAAVRCPVVTRDYSEAYNFAAHALLRLALHVTDESGTYRLTDLDVFNKWPVPPHKRPTKEDRKMATNGKPKKDKIEEEDELENEEADDEVEDEEDEDETEDTTEDEDEGDEDEEEANEEEDDEDEEEDSEVDDEEESNETDDEEEDNDGDDENEEEETDEEEDGEGEDEEDEPVKAKRRSARKPAPVAPARKAKPAVKRKPPKEVEEDDEDEDDEPAPRARKAKPKPLVKQKPPSRRQVEEETDEPIKKRSKFATKEKTVKKPVKVVKSTEKATKVTKKGAKPVTVTRSASNGNGDVKYTVRKVFKQGGVRGDAQSCIPKTGATLETIAAAAKKKFQLPENKVRAYLSWLCANGYVAKA